MMSSLYLLANSGVQEQPNLFMTLIPIVGIIVIFYLFLIRPMKKRQRQVDTMIANLKNGDKVITGGGIYGTIAGLRDKSILLKVADNVKIEVAKNSVVGLQPEQSSEEK